MIHVNYEFIQVKKKKEVNEQIENIKNDGIRVLLNYTYECKGLFHGSKLMSLCEAPVMEHPDRI